MAIVPSFRGDPLHGSLLSPPGMTAMRFLPPLLVLVTALLLPFGEADATIYKYELEDGTVLFTTEPQRGMTPVEIIGDEPARSRPAPATGSRRERVIPDPPARPNPNPTRSPDAFDDIIREAAEAYDLPFEFIKAVIRAESGFDPHAISHVGAQGLMQLMPRTAESLNCEDPFDPRQNIMAGTQYLRVLANRFGGDFNLVLAAYNAGQGLVNNVGGIPYQDTRRYIQRVYQYYQEYLAASREASATP